MKENIPILSNVVVIGDEQRFLAMLVTLRCEVKLKDAHKNFNQSYYCLFVVSFIE